MLIGYNTNGFAHHRLGDALNVIREIGYQSVALTVESDLLDPPDQSGVEKAFRAVKPLFDDLDLRVTIETGARFILDPRRKHQPTLISASASDRQRRIDFLKATLDFAAALSADSVSLWSGVPDDSAQDAEHFDRLVASLQSLLHHADGSHVRLAFEPEPGMLIDTMDQFRRLHEAIAHPQFGLTLDVGHIYCLADGNVDDHVRRWKDVLWNVHIEDMRRGLHEHLMFGDGDMDFGPVLSALREIDYQGPIHVELSRHSHNAVTAARQAYQFLNSL
jgi:L-ribulose-5-phosphate 3-epimerase